MNRITPNMIEAAIVRQDFFTAAEGALGAAMAASYLTGQPGGSVETPDRLEQVTICVLTLANGHVQVGVNYGPVDPAQFDPMKAREMARAEAFNQLWPLFGFALREHLHKVPEGGGSESRQ